VWRRPKRLAVALAPPMVAFVAWDLWASASGTWGFDRRYTIEHVPLVKAVPGLSSFQLSHPQGGTPYLVAELFWPSEDAFKASAATPEMAETRNHAEGCGTTFTVYTGDVAERMHVILEDVPPSALANAYACGTVLIEARATGAPRPMAPG